MPKQCLCQRKVVAVLIKQHATKSGGAAPYIPNLEASGEQSRSCSISCREATGFRVSRRVSLGISYHRKKCLSFAGNRTPTRRSSSRLLVVTSAYRHELLQDFTQARVQQISVGTRSVIRRHFCLSVTLRPPRFISLWY